MLFILLLCVSFVYCDVTCDKQQTFPLTNEGFAEGTRGSNHDYYLQTGKHILKTDEELNVISTADDFIDSNHQCQRVFNHPDGKHVFSVCLQYGAFPFLQVFRCEGTQCIQLGKTQEIWNCGDQFSKLEVVGNTIIVLNALRDYPYHSNGVAGRLMFMNYILTDTDFQLKLPSYYIDSYFFGSITPIEINDFSIYQENEDQKYKIFLADRDNGLLWVDCQLRQNTLIPGTGGKIDLKPYIYMKQYEIIMTSRILGKKDNTYDILGISNNNNHNIVSVIFNNEGQLLRYFIKISLQRYQDWPANNRLDVFQNYFAVSYWSPNMINAISIYKLDSNTPISTILHSQQTYQVVFFGLRDGEVVLNYRSNNNVITQCIIVN